MTTQPDIADFFRLPLDSLLRTIAVTGLVLIPLLSHAQQRVLEEVVVTAQKRAESMQDVPVAVTALNEAALERSGITNLEDLSAYVPSMQFGSFTNTVTVAIRGIGYTNTTAGGDPGVALHLDGVYMGRPVAGAFNTYDLNRMEVLRGPQGTLFGRNTTGGSVNFITNKPGNELEAKADVSWGSYEHLITRGTVNLPINDRISTRFNIAFSDSDGYQKNLVPGGTDANDEDYLNFRGQMRIDVSDDIELLISGSRSDTSGVSTKSERRLPFPVDGVVTAGPPIPGFRNFAGVPDQFLQTILSDEFFNRPDINAILTSRGINSVADVEAFLAARGQIVPGGGGIGLFMPTPGGSLNPVPPLGLVDDGDFSLAQANDLRENRVRKNTRESSDLELSTISATLSWDLGWAEFKSITGYADESVSNFADLDDTEVFLMDILLEEEQDQFSQELQLTSQTSENLEWLFGLYLFMEDATRISTIFNPDFDAFGALLGRTVPNGSQQGREVGFRVGGSIESNSYAVFSQVAYNVLPRLKITAGARFSWDEKEAFISLLSPFPSFDKATIIDNARVRRSWREPTWTFKADYALTDDVLLYVSRSRGYKSGGINLNGVPATAVVEPEFTAVWEIGAKTQFGDRLRFNLAAFHNDFSDIQVQNFGPAGAEIINAAAATILGVEAEGTYLITDSTEFNLSIGWLDAEFDDFPFTPATLPSFPFLVDPTDPRGPSGGPIPVASRNFAGNTLTRSPEITFSAGLQQGFTLPNNLGNLMFRADYHYQSKQFFDFDNGRDVIGNKYYNLNLRLRWDSVDEKYFVEAFGTNVTDQDQIGDVLRSIPFLGLGVDLTSYNQPAAWGVRVGYAY